MSAVHYTEDLTFNDYLKMEEEREERHEYVAGRVYAMAGGTANHNIVTLNLASSFLAHLRGTPCRTFSENMKLRIRQFDDFRSFYPDVFVACNSSDNHPLFRDEPKLIVEVLSDGTARSDIEEKLPLYRQLPSVEEILYVDSREAGWTMFRRSNDWAPETSDNLPDSVIAFPSIDFQMTLAEIYSDTELLKN